MRPDWEDEDFWSDLSNDPLNKKNKAGKSSGSSSNSSTITLRPPLYNAEDYTTALKQHFSSHLKNKASVIIEHSSSSPATSTLPNGFYEKNLSTAIATGKNYMDHLLPETPPEMSMRNFLNGSELLFKLEADLRHAFPTFVQEFVSGQCEGVACLMETLKVIQSAIDAAMGLREQRKLFMDELKCLHCLKLCLRNIEAVSKLTTYAGGLYSLATAMISTVTTTRIIGLEIMTSVCAEGGPEGHFRVSEAISTLRLRMGEPIRCKLLVGAISSAPPGSFQAKGIKFLTAWVSSASSPRQKVHIQCELEEAGFNPQSLRKGAGLGGARESREVQAELDAWNNIAIDVETLTRQNCQLRNSVATLQQELATLKDKIKRMDAPSVQKSNESPNIQSRPAIPNGNNEKPIQPIITKPKIIRAEELVTTPVDSEEEAEQIHQILEDLNNIVNSEMSQQPKDDDAKKSQKLFPNNANNKKEKDIVPIHLVKSPPPKKMLNSSPTKIIKPPRPWPSSSASDEDYEDDDQVHDAEDDDSDIVKGAHSPVNPNASSTVIEPATKNVRQVIEQLEQKQLQLNNKEISNGHKKHYQKHNAKSHSMNQLIEPKPDYNNNPLPNFHKQNHMANKFVNFKSSKLYSSSPDNSLTVLMSSSSSSSSPVTPKSHLPKRISPTLEKVQKHAAMKARQQKEQQILRNGGKSSQLRRSESLHTSLTSILFPKHSDHGKSDKKSVKPKGNSNCQREFEKWKSVDDLLQNGDEIEDDENNFTLRWKYPQQGQGVKSNQSLALATANARSKSEEKRKKKPSDKKSTPVISSSSPATSSGKSDHKLSPAGVFELYTDYRQSRFVNGTSSPNLSSGKGSPVHNNSSSSLGTLNFLSRYTKKSSNNNGIGKSCSSSSRSGGSNSSGNSLGLGHVQTASHLDKKKRKSTKINGNNENGIHFDTRSNEGFNGKDPQSITMFSLPPIFVSQGIDLANHRICDLPSGLY